MSLSGNMLLTSESATDYSMLLQSWQGQSLAPGDSCICELSMEGDAQQQCYFHSLNCCRYLLSTCCNPDTVDRARNEWHKALPSRADTLVAVFYVRLCLCSKVMSTTLQNYTLQWLSVLGTESNLGWDSSQTHWDLQHVRFFWVGTFCCCCFTKCR